MSIDKNVAAVLALEAPARALLKAFEAAKPALQRLEGANYAAAEWVAFQLEETTEPGTDGSLDHVIRGLEMFRNAGGSLAAYDFEFFSRYFKLSVDEAAKEMVQGNGTGVENLDRVKAMRQYAASVA